jgi:hypothetical protein
VVEPVRSNSSESDSSAAGRKSVKGKFPALGFLNRTTPGLSTSVGNDDAPSSPVGSPKPSKKKGW